MSIDIHIGPLRILWNKPVVTRLESYENATRVLSEAIGGKVGLGFQRTKAMDDWNKALDERFKDWPKDKPLPSPFARY
jgi:hypothetical protein